MSDWMDLRNASTSWQVPAADIAKVQERARILTRRRRALTSSISILLVLMIAGSGLYWSKTSTDDFRLQHAGGTVEGARAATFVFNALLETTDYVHPEIGAYDYKSVDQIGTNEWVVSFEVGADPREIRQTLRSRVGFLEEHEQDDRLRDEIRELRARLEDAVRLGGPFDFEATVLRSGEKLQITRIEGPVMADARKEMLAFEENVIEIQAQGTEHWQVRARIRQEGSVSLLASTFWTGPIPSSYRETCLLSLVDRNGKTVYTESQKRVFAQTPETAPSSEDLRDWGYGKSGGEVPKRLVGRKDLHGEVNCHPVDGEGWVSVGEAAIEPVTERFSMASSERLNPKRHVMVSSDVVYRGDPGIESICIARVFDDEGEEISSHGLTILEEELDALYGKGFPVEIPVDVGDPDAADYATVDCQPTVPGVNLGPDQED